MTDTERWTDQERDLDEERYNRELMEADEAEPEWDSQDSNGYHDREDEGAEPSTTFWDTAKGPEAMTTPDWQKVYGDGWEERIWDGRGLNVNDALAKPEPEREAGQ